MIRPKIPISSTIYYKFYFVTLVGISSFKIKKEELSTQECDLSIHSMNVQLAMILLEGITMR